MWAMWTNWDFDSQEKEHFSHREQSNYKEAKKSRPPYWQMISCGCCIGDYARTCLPRALRVVQGCHLCVPQAEGRGTDESVYACCESHKSVTYTHVSQAKGVCLQGQCTHACLELRGWFFQAHYTLSSLIPYFQFLHFISVNSSRFLCLCYLFFLIHPL